MPGVISGTGGLPQATPPPATQAGPPIVVQKVSIPGPPGTPGVNAFTLTQATFTMPAQDGVTVVYVDVLEASWMVPGQNVFVQSAGTMVVTRVVSELIVGLVNPTGATGNASPGTPISLGMKISPGGEPGGGGGGSGPDVPVVPGTYQLVVPVSGPAFYDIAGGPQINSFGGISGLLEVGTSVPTVSWTASYNAVPSTITISWSGVASGSMGVGVTGTSSSGTITGPFPSTVSGTSLVVTLSVLFQDGTTRTASQTLTFGAKVVWGSITNPVSSQSLWNNLNGQNNNVNPTLNQSMSFASQAGQQQAFGVLTALGPPTLRDQSGDIYDTTFLGAANVTENGTTQNYGFYTVGAPGITFAWNMS